MQDKQKERWKELCEQASNEQDPIRLSELVAEIDCNESNCFPPKVSAQFPAAFSDSFPV
jgi:hypothetical protein